MSGEDLARAVGYRQQSAIGNLENRGGGNGGKKLPEIARALRVPLAWLMEGPDDGEIPFAEPAPIATPSAAHARVANEQRGAYTVDASLAEAVDLFTRLRTEQRVQAIALMRELLAGRNPEQNRTTAGNVIPFPSHGPRKRHQASASHHYNIRETGINHRRPAPTWSSPSGRPACCTSSAPNHPRCKCERCVLEAY